MQDLINYGIWRKNGYKDKIEISDLELIAEFELAIMIALIDSELIPTDGDIKVFRNKYLTTLYYVNVSIYIEHTQKEEKIVLELGIDLFKNKIYSAPVQHDNYFSFEKSIIFHFQELIPCLFNFSLKISKMKIDCSFEEVLIENKPNFIGKN